jgi:hypothetical protein
MHKYVIERTLPGAGRLSSTELRDIAQKSNSVIRELGAADLQWVESFVVEDKIFCVYTAKDPAIIREHGQCGGFPVDQIYRVKTVIDPTTAEG